jgi:hypothetical protein
MRNRVIDFLLYSVVPLIPIAIMAAVSLWCYRQCGDGDGEAPADTVSVVRNEVHDTVYVEVHDTVPVVKRERVLCYVKVPVRDSTFRSTFGRLQGKNAQCSTFNDSMAVVQREYSDDSTYTAYVSGLLYQDWPKLDSITVRQRTITNTVTQTVTLLRRQSRFTLSAGIGYGYGFSYRGFEPYIGITLGYRLLPP